MASVTYDQATRFYPGTERPAVDSLDLEIVDGELLVLVGPSGSGKSTALRMLAGLEPLDDGRIKIGDRDVSQVRAPSLEGTEFITLHWQDAAWVKDAVRTGLIRERTAVAAVAYLMLHDWI